MKKQELIEKLRELATFFTLAQGDAKIQARDAGNRGEMSECTTHECEADIYETASKKLNKILKEVK